MDSNVQDSKSPEGTSLYSDMHTQLIVEAHDSLTGHLKRLKLGERTNLSTFNVHTKFSAHPTIQIKHMAHRILQCLPQIPLPSHLTKLYNLLENLVSLLHHIINVHQMLVRRLEYCSFYIPTSSFCTKPKATNLVFYKELVSPYLFLVNTQRVAIARPLGGRAHGSQVSKSRSIVISSCGAYFHWLALGNAIPQDQEVGRLRGRRELGEVMTANTNLSC